VLNSTDCTSRIVGLRVVDHVSRDDETVLYDTKYSTCAN